MIIPFIPAFVMIMSKKKRDFRKLTKTNNLDRKNKSGKKPNKRHQVSKSWSFRTFVVFMKPNDSLNFFYWKKERGEEHLGGKKKKKEHDFGLDGSSQIWNFLERLMLETLQIYCIDLIIIFLERILTYDVHFWWCSLLSV